MNQLKEISNQELLAELRLRIINGEIEVEWEDTYGDSSTITELSTRMKGRREKWFHLNFDEALAELKKREKLKKKKP